MKKNLLRFIVLALAALAATSLALVPSTNPVESPWGGYVVVRVPLDDGAALGAVLDSPQAPGVAIHMENQKLAWSGISRLEPVTFDRLERALVQNDPRMDPYLEKILNFFIQDDSAFAYVAVAPSGTAGPSLSQWSRFLKEALPTAQLSTQPPNPVPAWPLYLALVLPYLWYRRDRLVRIVPVIIPTLAFSTVRSVEALPLSLALALFWSEWTLPWSTILDRIAAYGWQARELERLNPRTVQNHGLLLVFFVLASSALIYLIKSWWLIPWLGTLTAVVLGIVAVSYGQWLLSGRRSHGVFVPVPMVSQPQKFFAPYAGIALALGILLPAVFGTWEASFAHPIPRYIDIQRDEAQFSFASLPRSGESPFPLIGDFIDHKAYQMGLPYGRQFAIPAMGEEVVLTRFNQEGLELQPYREVVARFDQQWYLNQLNGEGEYSIIRILEQKAQQISLVEMGIGQIYSLESAMLSWVFIGLLSLAVYLHGAKASRIHTVTIRVSGVRPLR